MSGTYRVEVGDEGLTVTLCYSRFLRLLGVVETVVAGGAVLALIGLAVSRGLSSYGWLILFVSAAMALFFAYGLVVREIATVNTQSVSVHLVAGPIGGQRICAAVEGQHFRARRSPLFWSFGVGGATVGMGDSAVAIGSAIRLDIATADALAADLNEYLDRGGLAVEPAHRADGAR